jgi:hypothetical protein
LKNKILEKIYDFGILCRVDRNPYPTHTFDILTNKRNKAAKVKWTLFKRKTSDVVIDNNENCKCY